MSFSRYAIYYVPPSGPLATFGAKWLGWDLLTNSETPQFNLSGLAGITRTPRKYGFHGTLKPPFRLSEGAALVDLQNATQTLAATLAPATCERLQIAPLGRFLALTPTGDLSGLQRIASACVRELDSFRAPLSEEELTQRRKARLTAHQEALLQRWGYPYVMEQFRFHMTLSGRLPQPEIAVWHAIATAQLPDLPEPFVVDQIALCGEREDGQFELIHRYALAG